MSQTWHSEILVGWTALWTGVLSGVGIYLTVVLLTRLFTQRVLTTVASFDFPVTIAIGAIVGRTALVHTSLLGGVVALLTLFSMQAAVGFVRNRLGIENLVGTPPRILVLEGHLMTEELRRSHLSPADVYEKLRISGVARLSEVRLMVHERGGGMSVIVGREALEEALIDDVVRDSALRERLTRPLEPGLVTRGV